MFKNLYFLNFRHFLKFVLVWTRKKTEQRFAELYNGRRETFIKVVTMPGLLSKDCINYRTCLPNVSVFFSMLWENAACPSFGSFLYIYFVFLFFRWPVHNMAR
jgi:hypothetical protein